MSTWYPYHAYRDRESYSCFFFSEGELWPTIGSKNLKLVLFQVHSADINDSLLNTCKWKISLLPFSNTKRMLQSQTGSTRFLWINLEWLHALKLQNIPYEITFPWKWMVIFHTHGTHTRRCVVYAIVLATHSKFFTRAVNNFLIDDEPSVNKPHELCGVVVKLIDIKRGKMDSGKISNQLSIVSTHCSCKWPNFLYWHVSWGTLNKTIGLNRSSQIDNKHSLLVRLHSLWQVGVSRRQLKYFTKYV